MPAGAMPAGVQLDAAIEAIGESAGAEDGAMYAAALAALRARTVRRSGVRAVLLWPLRAA